MTARDGLIFGNTFLTDDMALAFEDFERACRHRHYSEKTIEIYRGALIQFEYFLVNRPDEPEAISYPTEIERITREHIWGFLTWQKARVSQATYHQRYRSLKSFFNYFVNVLHERQDNPLATIPVPELADKEIPTIPREHIKALIAVAEGPGLRKPRNARDAAILWLFIATPARLGEVTGLRLRDLDLKNAQIHISGEGRERSPGKGNRERTMNLGPRSLGALERYVRVRDRLPGAAETDMLWLGTGGGRSGVGPLKRSGVVFVIRRLCQRAGVPRYHVHQFRHTFATEYLFKGGNESVLMTEAGWSSILMIRRYTKAAATRLARQEYARVNITEGL